MQINGFKDYSVKSNFKKNFLRLGQLFRRKKYVLFEKNTIGNFKIAYSYFNNQLIILRIVHKGSPFGKI